MTTLKRLLSLLALLAVAGCGGGGGASGACQFNCSNTPTASSVAGLDIQLSAATIANISTASVTATVTALDANNNAVSGAPVSISADSGVITVSGTGGSVTNASGQVQATVTLGSNLTLRTITIKASTGAIAASDKTLQVIATPTGAVPTTVEIISSAPSVGTGGDAVTIRAFVKDANNNALPNTAIGFSTTTGTLSSVGTVTDASGSASATFTAGAIKSNRSAVITVTSGTVANTLTLPITGTKLTLSGPSSLVLGNVANFDIVVTDSRSNVVPNVTITAVSSLGNPVIPVTNAVTNSGGQVSFRYTANNAGNDTLVFSSDPSTTVSPNPALVVSGQDFTFVSPAASTVVNVNTPQLLQVRLRNGGTGVPGQTINFAATGGTLTSSTAVTDNNGLASVSLQSTSAGPITVQATVAGSTASTTLPLLVVATVPNKLVLQISPTALAPNLGTSNSNQAQVVAKVTDLAGNPVQGVTVNFTRVADPSNGNLLQVSATTDANGQASVAYQSGSQSTANNGVVIGATVASAPAVTGQATLTVNQSSLFIALGTGNVITNIDPQTYKKDWSVYVTDANSIPVNGATLTIKAVPTYYLTGSLFYNGVVWTYKPNSIYRCRNEDANANGILDPGEDDNGDGVLWPGNVIAVTPGTVQTNNGLATVSLIYAESYAPWVQLRLTASATVAGTESRTDAEFIVGGEAGDFSSQTNAPAGVVSPFGATPKPGAVCSLYF